MAAKLRLRVPHRTVRTECPHEACVRACGEARVTKNEAPICRACRSGVPPCAACAAYAACAVCVTVPCRISAPTASWCSRPRQARARAVGQKVRAGRALDFVCLSTRAPHGGASHVQASERNRSGRHSLIVERASCKLGRFNIFRLWGGGMFLPDAWYEECDQAGIMVSVAS